MLTFDERFKKIEKYVKYLSDEDFGQLLNAGRRQYEKSWHPFNQTSFDRCVYCGSNGHSHLCNDGIARNFCLECKERAKKEFLD